QRDTALEQRLEQRAENHRVRDVGNEELIEAQHARLRGDGVGDDLQRRLTVRQLLQLCMHVVHEAVKVPPALLLERQAVEEQVHQPGLAATDTAPQVQP